MYSEAELFHYTSHGGLEGMWRSGKIWASRFDRLNDSSEMKHFGDQILNPMKMAMSKFIEKNNIGGKICGMISGNFETTEKAVEFASKNFVKVLIDSVFNKLSPPFITSFCTHDNEYEINNGLLSQWRGYGDSGYAIVFDKEGIGKAIEDELMHFSYQAILMRPAIYEVETLIEGGLYDHVIDTLVLGCLKAIQDEADAFSLAFEKFAFASFAIKHPGFREEREVRVICCPLTRETMEAFRYDNPVFEPNYPLKPIYERDHPRTKKKVPYIELFSGRKGRLPINRIIVGPGPDQAVRAAEVREMVQGEVLVTESITPFIG